MRLIVRDTGTGMSEETIQHAFEPFYTTKENGTGTGLGLATVHGIVVDAGGSVTLDSAPGLGTAVVVELPVCEDAVTVAVEPDTAGTAPGHGETVLVCDDELDVRRLVERILSRAGYAVVGAATPEAALATCGMPVDLLLTDVVMPGMAGPELAERLRRERPGLRVLMTSGDARIDDPALLAKPFGADELLRAVRVALDQPSPIR